VPAHSAVLQASEGAGAPWRTFCAESKRQQSTAASRRCHRSQAFILFTGADDDHPLFVNKSIERAQRLLIAHCQDTDICDKLGRPEHSAAVSAARGPSSAGRLGQDARILYLEKLVATGMGADRHL